MQLTSQLLIPSHHSPHWPPPHPAKASTSSSSATNSNISTTTMESDGQFWPCLPISYNEILLKKLHGHSQIRKLNNLSIPQPRETGKETSTSEENMKSMNTLSMDYSESDSESD